MTKLCSDFELVDIFQDRHGFGEFATYSRGTKRIDYCLATPRASTAAKFIGYDPFGHRLFSDHRELFVDFDTHILFGDALATMPPLKHRDIKSNNPKQVTIYLEELHRMCKSRNIFQHIDQLLQLESPDHALAETLMRDMDQFRQAAVKKLSKQFQSQWSVSIATIRNKVNVLKRALFMCRTGYKTTQQILELQASTGADYLIPDTVSECNTLLRTAQQELKQAVTENRQRRDQEARARAIELDLSIHPSSKKQAAIQKKLLSAEKRKTMFAKLHHLLDSQKSGLSVLEIPTNPTDNPKSIANIPAKWTTLTVPAEIESALQERNRKHFGQAQGTQFTIPPLRGQLDFQLPHKQQS